LIQAQQKHGNKWSLIAGKYLPGRTENAIKTRHKSLARAPKREWQADEDALLMSLVPSLGKNWDQYAEVLPNRNRNVIRTRVGQLCSNLSLSVDDGASSSSSAPGTPRGGASTAIAAASASGNTLSFPNDHNHNRPSVSTMSAPAVANHPHQRTPSREHTTNSQQRLTSDLQFLHFDEPVGGAAGTGRGNSEGVSLQSIDLPSGLLMAANTQMSLLSVNDDDIGGALASSNDDLLLLEEDDDIQNISVDMSRGVPVVHTHPPHHPPHTNSYHQHHNNNNILASQQDSFSF
jgi:hypothetical protein